MNTTSFYDELIFSDKISTRLILESSFSKEIRILLPEGEEMKEHSTKFPIVVQVLSGEIDFGVAGTTHLMRSGEIIALEGNIPHDLKASTDTVIRLTLSKHDKMERLDEVVKKSNA